MIEGIKYYSFNDWLKKNNSFLYKHEFNEDQNNESSVFPKGSSFGGRKTGMARKSSFMQSSKGKKTIGSQGSMKDSGSVDPLESLDIQSVKEKLDLNVLSKLERVSDIIDMDIDEIIQGAISGSVKKGISVTQMIDKLISMYL